MIDRALRLSGPQVTNEVLRSVLRRYEHLAYSRLQEIGLQPVAIFDIGAYHGDWSRGARVVFPAAKIVMVEAQAELQPILHKVADEIGNASVHTAVLAADQGDVTFYTMGTGSSMRAERSNAVRQAATLRATTLNEVWHAEEMLDGPIFVKIDVQGAELEVLRGGGELLQQAEWVQLEVALLSYNEEAPQLREVCNFMADRGFFATEVTGFSRPQRHLVQIDMLFARDSSALRPAWFEF